MPMGVGQQYASGMHIDIFKKTYCWLISSLQPCVEHVICSCIQFWLSSDLSYIVAHGQVRGIVGVP